MEPGSVCSDQMLSRTFSSLAPLRVTLSYVTALFVVATTLLALGPRVQDSVVSQLSTNLRNLGHGHVGTLFGSAFVTSEGQTYLLLPGLVCLLGLAELLWCSRRLVQAFVLGHVGATLIVAGVLAIEIEFRWQPISIAGASDVGLSYGAVAVLGTLTAAMPSRWRPAWISGWLTIALMMVVATWGADFTAIGHAIALMLGMGLSGRFRVGSHWTRMRLGLLTVGVAFGVLLLVGVFLPTAPVAVPAGVAAALIAQWATRRWRRPCSPPAAVPAPESRPLASQSNGRYGGLPLPLKAFWVKG